MNIIKAFCRATQSGDNVFDIGTFDGTTSLSLSRFVGESGKMYAFEAHPLQFVKLSKFAALDYVDNIFPFCKALSDKKGHFKLYAAKDADRNLNQASTLVEELKTEERLGKDFISFMFETETLDAICHDLNAIPQFIKIDTQKVRKPESLQGVLKPKKNIIQV
jgi:FkbM family methyltransferase